MRRKIGNTCIILGTALVLGALALFLYNRQEAEEARRASDAHLAQLVGMLKPVEEGTAEGETVPAGEGILVDMLPQIPEELLTPEDLVMTETVIDGNAYIGYLSMPTVDLELPILSDWSYSLLRIAPCRYYGTLRGNDLVLMAHNYATHFGPISRLQEGDPVIFVDMDGGVTRYRVAAHDILDPTAVEEMTAGVFDLTLFTCTYGGKSRVTVYCNRE